MRHMIVVLSAALAIVFGSKTSFADYGYFTMGKYHRPTLNSQNGFCRVNICDKCMNTNFPEAWNPFDDQNWHNCNGIIPGLAIAKKYLFWGPSDWVYFTIFTQRTVLEQTVSACNQHHVGDVNCTYFSTVDSLYHDLPGAYIIGSEFSLSTLDSYINRGVTGWPVGPCEEDLSMASSFIQSTWEEMGRPSDGGWEVILYGSLYYLTYLVIDGGVVAAGDETLGQTSELVTARKLVAHSLTAMQSWERPYPDIIGSNGIAPFCNDETCTPTFVYCIWHAFHHIVRPYVAAEETTWGMIKAKYE